MKKVTGLKMLLHSHSMTQGELAEALGVSQATVSFWATGKSKMSQDVQEKILKAVENKNKHVLQDNDDIEIVKDIKKDLPKTLEARIRDCKKHCLETYGFKIIVVDNK